MALTERERALVDFERTWWLEPGEPGRTTKGAAIRTRLGISAARYYAVLQHLIDSPDAAEYDPLVVRRLRHRRTERRRAQFEPTTRPHTGRPR